MDRKTELTIVASGEAHRPAYKYATPRAAARPALMYLARRYRAAQSLSDHCRHVMNGNYVGRFGVLDSGTGKCAACLAA